MHLSLFRNKYYVKMGNILDMKTKSNKRIQLKHFEQKKKNK